MSEYKYLFGPVPSRRLGRSLGVDIVPLKVCSQNCIYCQLGVNADTVLERAEYININEVLSELKSAVEKGLDADYITLTGSGEPTLNSRIGDLIDGIRRLTNIPVAILTNGTLFNDPKVRSDCAKADVVMPSLDAGDEETFKKMNRPHSDIKFNEFIEGLCKFRKDYCGRIWLEVFFCEGINTDPEQIDNIRRIVERIGPDRVQLNTSVRPTVEKDVVRVDPVKLMEIALVLGLNSEVIADFSRLRKGDQIDAETERIVEMLKRRPCTLDDICNGLGAVRNEVAKIISVLEAENQLVIEELDSGTYYSVHS